MFQFNVIFLSGTPAVVFKDGSVHLDMNINEVLFPDNRTQHNSYAPEEVRVRKKAARLFARTSAGRCGEPLSERSGTRSDGAAAAADVHLSSSDSRAGQRLWG